MAESAALVIALALMALIGGFALVLGMPPGATSPKVARALLALAPDEVAGPVVELGSGWGTLAMALARRYPACTVVGYELSPVPWLVSRIILAVRPTANLRLRYGDFRRADLSGASLVVCYLVPRAMAALRPKLEHEMPAGAWVLSSTFAVPGWTPVEETRADDLYRSPVYLYRIGGKNSR